MIKTNYESEETKKTTDTKKYVYSKERSVYLVAYCLCSKTLQQSNIKILSVYQLTEPTTITTNNQPKSSPTLILT